MIEEIRLAETEFPDVEVTEEKDFLTEADLEPPYKMKV